MNLFIFLQIYLFMTHTHICIQCVCQRGACVRSDDNFQKSILTSHLFEAQTLLILPLCGVLQASRPSTWPFPWVLGINSGPLSCFCSLCFVTEPHPSTHPGSCTWTLNSQYHIMHFIRNIFVIQSYKEKGKIK